MSTIIWGVLDGKDIASQMAKGDIKEPTTLMLYKDHNMGLVATMMINGISLRRIESQMECKVKSIGQRQDMKLDDLFRKAGNEVGSR